ncbi:MAG: GntR family transcriptional regulator [Pseudomonadota bacterium]
MIILDKVQDQAVQSADQGSSDLASVLRKNMGVVSSNPGLTKRSAARLAIAEAIRSGELAPGDRLPPEKELTAILGVSLGTVQAALQQLQLVGAIVRRRGDGSRVASAEPFSRSVWHFRFISKEEGLPLRIVQEAATVDRLTEHGMWSTYLGDRPDYIRVRRRITMHEGTRAGADMYLDGAMVPGLEEIDTAEFDMINIRPYLAERYGIATAGADHEAQLTSLTKQEAAPYGLDALEPMFEVHAKAYGPNRKPVYFQRILISANRTVLTF